MNFYFSNISATTFNFKIELRFQNHAPISKYSLDYDCWNVGILKIHTMSIYIFVQSNKFVFNKIFFVLYHFFHVLKYVLIQSERKFVFNKISFRYIPFYYRIKIYLYSFKIALYSVRNVFIIYFIHGFQSFLLHEFLLQCFSGEHVRSSFCICKSRNFTFRM